MAEDLSSDSGAVLFVDDDADVLASAAVLLGRHGYRMATARTPTEAWSVLAAEPVDVILLDLNFTAGATSGGEGLRWLSEIRARDRDAVVVVVTAHSGVNVAVTAMKSGASDFVMKPWNNARFLETVGAAQALRRQRRQARGAQPPGPPELAPILGESAAIGRVRALIDRLAPTEASVLIHGEPGSGKSLAARTLHARSPRAAGPFVSFDARGLMPEAIGAPLRRAVAEAAGGVLFLDEIAALSPAAQAELSALLDGDPDIRLVSATGDRGALAAMRQDLAARLATVELALPTLAERGYDTVLLTEHFVRLFARRYGRAPKPLDAQAMSALQAAPPPGEVRGLRQAAERAVVLSEGTALTAADFAPPAAPGAVAAQAGGDLNLARSEKAVVEAALKRHAHNVSQAARELGVTRATLYRRMVKHGL